MSYENKYKFPHTRIVMKVDTLHGGQKQFLHQAVNRPCNASMGAVSHLELYIVLNKKGVTNNKLR